MYQKSSKLHQRVTIKLKGNSVNVNHDKMPSKSAEDTKTHSSSDRHFRNDGSRMILMRDRHDTDQSGELNQNKCKYVNLNDIEKTLPDDPRISKMMRRLLAETDPEASAAIAMKLLDMIVLPENEKYVQRAYLSLADTLLEVLELGLSRKTKVIASKCLGRIAYVMGDDFNFFLSWLSKEYSKCREDECKIFLMRSLIETYQLEKINNKLFKFFLTILQYVLDQIEKNSPTDLIFMTTMDVALAIYECYPDVTDCFEDIVDYIVGWLIVETSWEKVQFAKNILTRLDNRWHANIEFSLNLLNDLIYDLAQICDVNSPRKWTQINIVSYIRVIGVVLKGLCGYFQSITVEDRLQFLSESFTKIIGTITYLINFDEPHMVVATNELTYIILDNMGAKSTLIQTELYQMIDTELNECDNFTEDALVSFMLCLSKTIKEISGNLPITFIRKLLDPENSPLIRARQSRSKSIQKSVINVYKSLLNLKNIPLLQETYKYVLVDLQSAYRVLKMDVTILEIDSNLKTYDEGDAQFIVLFLLNCLSNLANVSGSIIGIWALNPGLLQLLGVDLRISDVDLALNYPSIQYGVLYLLYSHCARHNHFVSSSDLIFGELNLLHDILLPMDITLSEGSTSSPTSKHLAIILNLIGQCLRNKSSVQVKQLILRWTHEIITLVQNNLEKLREKPPFMELLHGIIECAFALDTKIQVNVHEILSGLFEFNPTVNWGEDFYRKLSELCAFCIDSNDANTSALYFKLLNEIPLHVNLDQFRQIYSSHKIKRRDENQLKNDTESIITAQHLYMTHNTYDCVMKTQQFKKIITYLLSGIEHESNWFSNVFTSSWLTDLTSWSHKMGEMTKYSRSFVMFWNLWEAANYCVNNKLRTPLGKPTETFIAVESAIKKLATSSTESNIAVELLKKNNRIFLFINFLEYLEKLIYNAYEGCALALSPPSKPVRTFFVTNASTCRDWFQRIRSAIIVVGLHVGENENVVRQTHCLMGDLIAAKKVGSEEFERSVFYLAWAYLNMNEGHALTGLHAWCVAKDQSNASNYDWIKATVDQANNKYETAAIAYVNYLKMIKKQGNFESNVTKDEFSEIESSKMETRSQLVSFVNDQIAECYANLNWGEKLSELKIRDTNVKFSINWKKISAFRNEDKMKELSQWSDNFEFNNWSDYDLLDTIEAKLYHFANNFKQNDNFPRNFQNEIDILHQLMRKKVLNFTHTQVPRIVSLEYVLNAISSIGSRTYFSRVHFQNSKNLSFMLFWAEYFQHTLENDAHVQNMRLDLIRNLRREGNFDTARRQIVKHFNNRYENIDQIAEAIINNPQLFQQNVNDYSVVCEISKLLYANKLTKQLAINLCGITSTSVNLENMDSKTTPLQQKSSRMFLHLAKWLQSENTAFEHLPLQLSSFIELLPEVQHQQQQFTNFTSIVPIKNQLVGKLYQHATTQCETLPKVWFYFGSWCYYWGKKIVENENSDQLNDSDKNEIRRVMPMMSSERDLEQVYVVLSQTRTIHDAVIVVNEINTSEIIQQRLRQVSALSVSEPKQLIEIIDVWKRAQKRIYYYYELAATSYFRYLQLCTKLMESSTQADATNEYTTISATLRLLRLIVKHALELQSTLEDGLTTTPTQPWKSIIPQLFSRLNHPEKYVRTRVSELLCRIARDSPHLIIFSAVVGSSDAKMNGAKLPTKDLLHDDIDDAHGNEHDMNNWNNCFSSLVATLSEQVPESIQQVQVLVKEMRRITLLWDELWLATLLQHNSEIIRRWNMLEQEITLVNENDHLPKAEKEGIILEKHRVLMKPILYILQELNAITSVKWETPNEKMFQDKFAALIAEVILKFRSPADVTKPKEAWQALKLLQNRLQQRAHRRTFMLKITDVSPVLARLRDTGIAMPGSTDSNHVIKIARVESNISVLPTKTKPKKMVFIGSDGKKYTYLFKGLEDLHLDERIMQFLSVTNMMLRKNAEILPGKNLYKARHYSVTPLGPRSGLIRWVDGVTPVFSLYKRWQQRDSLKSTLKDTNGSQINANANVNLICRPSDLFYNKLNPLLKEYGLKNLDNRKEWPSHILKQVLLELIAETPQDLLAKEFWCHSTNACDWWNIIRNYSYSTAVMSIIGYIIGLGDRHLDNVLIDLTSGDVVHIDYNVCFEKGKTLRVPEKVPFRMTANIQTALGVTGVEGIFRVACEHVLKTMKKGRETLLTLLEAFVYDPLVDWTVGAEGLVLNTYTENLSRGSVKDIVEMSPDNDVDALMGSINPPVRQTRKELEHEVMLSMFNIRRVEIRSEWLINRTDMLTNLHALQTDLQQWLTNSKEIDGAKQYLKELYDQVSLIKDCRLRLKTGERNHKLVTLPLRYNSYKYTSNTIKNAKKKLYDCVEDCAKNRKLYYNAMVAIRGNKLTQWIKELNNFPPEHNNHFVFDMIKEFLQNAGQTAMVGQCEQSEKLLTQIAHQQGDLIRSALELLTQYSTIINYYPSDYIDANHRSTLFYKWCEMLKATKSPLVCDEVLAEIDSKFDKSIINATQAQHTMVFACQLKQLTAEIHAKLKSNMQRLQLEGVGETSVDEAYNNTKSSINSFLRDEKGAGKAFECVSITALCALNKRYLMMEQAASSAGDCLVDLHSMDGDWFLDEMHLMSALVTELAALIPLQHEKKTDPRINAAVNCLKCTNRIYKALLELNFNFYTIILPEAMRIILSEDPSILEVINDLNQIVLSAGIELPNLIGQLEIHLRCVIMQMESRHTDVQSIVAGLRKRYEDLIDNQSDNLKSGRMLLMGFNGLFDKLKVESNALIVEYTSIDMPTCWKKVDQFRESKALSALIFKENTRCILDDVLLLKRIQTIMEYFSICSQIASSFKGQIMTNMLSDAELSKPIRKFTADYVSRQLLGVTSQVTALFLCLLLQRMGLNVTNEIEQRDIGAEHKVPLEELCRKQVDLFLKRSIFTNNILAQASGLSSNLEEAVRRLEIVNSIKQQLEIQNAAQQRLQLQLTAYVWLHEDTLALQPNLLNLIPIVRSGFMRELRKISNALAGIQGRLTDARDNQRALIQSAVQRLKWAAGANPAFNDVMAAFECAVKIREDRLTLEQNLAVVVASTCDSLLYYETLRTRTSEALAHDANFVSLVKQWKEACVAFEQADITVTQIEESLMRLLPTDKPIDASWLEKADQLIVIQIQTQKEQISTNVKNLSVHTENVHRTLAEIKSSWTTHASLMSDLRVWLKTLAKFDVDDIGLQKYFVDYNQFVHKLTTVINLTQDIHDKSSLQEVDRIVDSVTYLEENIENIYMNLLELAINPENISLKSIREQDLDEAEMAGDVKESPAKRKNIKEQQRNAYAMGVWKRVHMKLEGRDPDHDKRYNVAEQVNYVIREATSLDNLALLYEGWTPWV